MVSKMDLFPTIAHFKVHGLRCPLQVHVRGTLKKQSLQSNKMKTQQKRGKTVLTNVKMLLQARHIYLVQLLVFLSHTENNIHTLYPVFKEKSLVFEQLWYQV